MRRHLQGAFARVFVDEFQDTDPVQAEILLLLAADDPAATDAVLVRPVPGKLFIVGDPKQAIYRFRGTDVGTYWRVSRQLEQQGARVLQLRTSYRSVPPLQRFVNAAFRAEMVASERTLQAGYVPLSRHRNADDSQPALVALPVPAPYSVARAAQALGARDRGVAAGCGRRVHRVARGRGERMADRGGERGGRREGADG